MRKIWTVVGCFALLTGAVALVTQSGSASASRPQRAQAGVAADSEGSPIEYLDGQVNEFDLGAYSGAYVGVAYVDNYQGLVVYVAANNSETLPLEAAIGSLDQSVSQSADAGAVIPVSFVTVPVSMASFQQESNRLARNLQGLERSGINLAHWNVAPKEDRLVAYVMSPSTRDLEHLRVALTNRLGVSAAQRMSFTSSSYLPDVTLLLQTVVGRWVQAAWSDQVTPLTLTGREDSGAPWISGQEVQSYEECSDGFIGTGKASGNPFMLSAGHCSQGNNGTEVDLESNASYELGTVSHTYWNNNSTNDDFDTIAVTPYPIGDPNVYGGPPTGGSDIYNIYGTNEPGSMSLFTEDGASTGERRGLVVTADGGPTDCWPTANNESPYQTYSVCNIIDGDTGQYDQSCYDGDSGGPEYVHDGSTNAVEASGTLVGIYWDGELDEHCVGEDVTAELDHASLNLWSYDGPPPAPGG